MVRNTGISLCVLCVILAMALPGAPAFAQESSLAPVANPQVEGTIDIWAWNIAAAALKNLMPEFNKRYPNVKAGITMSGANMQSRFLLSLSARVGAPDISQLQHVETPFYVDTERMLDLTPMAKKYEGQFAEAFWRNCCKDGKIYAIPWDMGPCAVFYKRSIFKRYGIDPESIEIWADYIEAGKVILEKSGGKTRMLFMPSGELQIMFEILQQQVGGQVFDDAGRIAINSPQNLKVVKLIREFIKAGITYDSPLWRHTFYASIKSDTVATYPMGAWFGGSIKDTAPETSGDWGVFRLPAVEPGGLRVSNLGGSTLVIPASGENLDAAWAFVEYAMCTKEGQISQYRDFDLFPAFLPAHDDPFFDEPEEFYGGMKVRSLFAHEIERIPTLNRTSDWEESKRYIDQMMSSWASRGMGDPGELLQAIEAKMVRRMGREKSPVSLSKETP